MRVVAKYRIGAKLPPGDPYREVMAQACRNNPPLCIDTPDKPKIPQQTKDPRSSIKLRSLQWLGKWSKQAAKPEGVKFVKPEEAKKRAAVCAVCPRNVKLPEGCSACRQALTSLRTAIVGGARPLDDRLGGCETLGCDLPAAVHLDEVRVKEAALPKECWRKMI